MTMRRLILVPVLIFLALAAIGAGIAYWIYDNYTFYRTDDAQLTSPIINVSAPAAGTLTTLHVKLGHTIPAGETTGTITGAPTASARGKSSSPTSVDITTPINGTKIHVPSVQGQRITHGLPI